MPLVFAAIMPHGDELLPFTAPGPGLLPLRRAMESIGAAMRAARPDVLVIASPHHLRIPGHLAIVDTVHAAGCVESGAGNYARDVRIDRGFNRVLADAAAESGLPPVRVGYLTSEGDLSCLPLDFGSLVPLYYLIGADEAPAVCVVGPPRDLGLRPLERFGAALAARCAERRVAFVASADQAHAHDAGGPYGFDPAAARYDALVQDAVRAGDLSPLLGLDSAFLDAAKPDAPWQMAILAGLLGGPRAAHDFAYARPTYFGMLTARFADA